MMPNSGPWQQPTLSSAAWDQRHPDLLLECLALGNKEQQRWPCPYYRATTHFPENCPTLLFVMENYLLHCLSIESPFHQFAVSSTRVAAPEPPATTVTSACPVEAATLKLAATEIKTVPDNNNPASLRSLTIECDKVDRQLHIYCRPQVALTSLTSEDPQQHHKLISDYKQ